MPNIQGIHIFKSNATVQICRFLIIAIIVLASSAEGETTSDVLEKAPENAREKYLKRAKERQVKARLGEAPEEVSLPDDVTEHEKTAADSVIMHEQTLPLRLRSLRKKRAALARNSRSHSRFAIGNIESEIDWVTDQIAKVKSGGVSYPIFARTSPARRDQH